MGDVDPGRRRLLKLVERYFGPLPATDPPQPVPPHNLEPLTEPARLDRVEAVPSDRLYLAFRLPVDGTPEYFACCLALDAVAGLATSRLVRRLVREEQVVTGLSAHSMGLVDGVSLGLVSLDVADGVDPATVEAVVVEEARALRAGGPHRGRAGGLDRRDRAGPAGRSRAWTSAPTPSATTRCSRATRSTSTPSSTASVRWGEQVRAAAARWLTPSARAVVAYRAQRPDVPDASDASDPSDTPEEVSA